MKLKTLKDIENQVCNGRKDCEGQYDLRDEIRQELGINRIKFIIERAEKHRKKTHGFEGQMDWDNAQIEILKEIFNIKKGELK